MNRRSVDFRQNLAITFLTVSAVLLFTRTEIFHLGRENFWHDFRLFPEETVRTADSRDSTLSVPVRLCASGPRGRHAIPVMATGDTAFPRELLGKALENTGEWESCTRSDFLHALDSISLYSDFLYPLPLSVLAGLSDAVCTEEFPVRCMVLSREGNAAALYLWDGVSEFSRRAADIPFSDLEEAVNSFGPGNAVFAMDRTDIEELNLWPLSILPDELPDNLPALSVRTGLTDTDQLLTALRFNPLTNFRYPESNGTTVVVDGSRSVRIRANGSVYYQGSGRPDVSVDSRGESPTLWEAALGCAAVLNDILTTREGGAPVYPMEAVREEDRMVLRFGYHVNGTPVRFPDGGSAAVAVLEGRNIVSLELRPRCYILTEEMSRFLPLPQALGIVNAQAEISTGYVDTGAARLEAQWLSEYSSYPG